MRRRELCQVFKALKSVHHTNSLIFVPVKEGALKGHVSLVWKKNNKNDKGLNVIYLILVNNLKDDVKLLGKYSQSLSQINLDEKSTSYIEDSSLYRNLTIYLYK